MPVKDVRIESYDPSGNPAQTAFHQSQSFTRLLVGGFGSGKSRCLYEEIFDIGQRFPGINILVTRYYDSDVEQVTMPEFYQFCPPELIAQKVGRILKWVNGTRITFRGLYTRSKQRVVKLGSLNLGLVAIDQFEEITEDDLRALHGRLRQAEVLYHGIIGALNPPDEVSWIAKRFPIGLASPSASVFRAPTRYNKKFLPEDYIDNMVKEYPEQWRQRFIEGFYGPVIKGQAVWKVNFDLNIKETFDLFPVKGSTIYRGWDFGWWRPACIWAWLDAFGRLRVVRELIGDQEYLQAFAQRVLVISNTEWPGMFFKDFCDFAGNQKSDKGKSCVSILADLGIMAVSKPSQVAVDCDLVQSGFDRLVQGQAAIQILKGCTNLVSGITGGYHRAEGKGDPVKDGFYEHACDAFRYLYTNLFSTTRYKTEPTEADWRRSKSKNTNFLNKPKYVL